MRRRAGATGRSRRLDIKVNARRLSLLVPPHRTLLEVLREDLNLTGTKHGCETGECGACTVLVDGRPVYSCLVLACRLEGSQVRTIEGVRSDDPVVAAFVETGAVQCGYCTPGMIMTAKAHVQLRGRGEEPSADGAGARAGAASGRRPEAAVRSAISGNLCRCTGYAKIVEAVTSCQGRGECSGPAKKGKRECRT